MATTTPVCTIDSTGISVPAYSDVLSWLISQYQSIYGSDVYLGTDSQDYQLLAIFALAIHDSNSVAEAVYNAFSPATAQGAGLSSVVKINGIARNTASNSTVDVTISGTAGTTITGGSVKDDNGYVWDLPASVVIPTAASITVTATCETSGAITAQAGTVTTINTPTRGWTSVTNASAASAGDAVETDAELRIRQTTSVALPSRTVLEGIEGAIAALTGVTRYKAYENNTATTDSNGVPSHSISIVVEGGDAASIASAIFTKKSPGTGTYGTTSETVTDTYGISYAIDFYRPTPVPITVAVAIKAYAGYTSSIGTEIQTAIVNYITALDIGDDVICTDLYVPAKLSGGTGSTTYKVSSIQISRDGAAVAASDVAIAFNEAATSSTSLVTLAVTS